MFYLIYLMAKIRNNAASSGFSKLIYIDQNSQFATGSNVKNIFEILDGISGMKSLVSVCHNK